MKKVNTILDYNKLRQVVVVSNVPSYLFQNFQINQTVQDLSCEMSEQELIGNFYELLNSKRDLDNLVSLYAILVALHKSDSQNVYLFFHNIRNLNDIKWITYFFNLYMAKSGFLVSEKTVVSSSNNTVPDFKSINPQFSIQ